MNQADRVSLEKLHPKSRVLETLQQNQNVIKTLKNRVKCKT